MNKTIQKLFALAVTLLLITALLAPAALAGETDPPDIGLTDAERAFIAQNGVFRVGFVQDRPPVSFTDENGELAGVSRYIFDELARLAGIRLEYVPLPAGSVTYDYLLSENLDLVTSVERNPENESARGILISEPYLKSRKVIVARQDLEFDMDKNLSVAVSSGSQTLRKVLQTTYPRFDLIDYDSIPDCFEAVISGESDLMILNQYVVEYWFGKPAYDDLKVIPVMGLDEQLCFSAVVTIDGVIGKSQESGQTLISIIDKAIANLSEEFVGGVTIQAAMENQYDLTFSDFLYRYRAAVTVLAVSAAAILALAGLLTWQGTRSARARAEARAKDSFLSAMSHEIRTPLNGLIGLNYLMAQNLNDVDRMGKYLDQSTSTAKYLLRLVSDILDMSKLQERKMDLERSRVDLALLVASVRAVTEPVMRDKGVAFDLAGDLPYPVVEGDEARIQQVLMNLLDNAAKFTPEGGHVTLSMAQRAVEGDSAVTTVFTVTDTGRGMSEDFKRHIFSAFSQELHTVSKGNQGAGLGLAISHELAALMGGDLTFESEKDRGSTFVFSFPGAVLPARDEATGPESPDLPRVKRRVLIAEDNELNLEIMLELLAEEGFDTVSAHDGREALEVFRESPPGSIDVILMDLLMPNLDGYGAARAIRALPREDAGTVRIIACTANTFAEDRRRALEAGMDDFIPKPVDVGELMEKLEV